MKRYPKAKDYQTVHDREWVKVPKSNACCDCGLVHDVEFRLRKTSPVGGSSRFFEQDMVQLLAKVEGLITKGWLTLEMSAIRSRGATKALRLSMKHACRPRLHRKKILDTKVGSLYNGRT
jgi:hypothetical protein